MGRHKMMLIEAQNKVGAEKGKHLKERKTFLSRVRVKRMDTLLGRSICIFRNFGRAGM
jgi:hypothetical protein